LAGGLVILRMTGECSSTIYLPLVLKSFGLRAGLKTGLR
jgi:hypothetical protein